MAITSANIVTDSWVACPLAHPRVERKRKRVEAQPSLEASILELLQYPLSVGLPSRGVVLFDCRGL